MKTYKIREFAKYLGVTEKTLRHYEKFRIVEPSVDENNRYRSYNFRDAERIVASKRFSSMDFSIKETSQMLNETTIDQILEKFGHQAENLEKEARRLKLVSGRIRELEEELKLFQKSPNQGFFCQGKEWWFIKHVENAEFVKDEESLLTIRRMMDAMPCSVKMMRLPEQSEEKIKRIWGLAIEPSYAVKFGIPFRKPMEIIQAKKCYCYPAVIPGKKERVLANSQDLHFIWENICQELKEKEISIVARPYLIGSIDSFSGNKREKHFLIWVPVGD